VSGQAPLSPGVISTLCAPSLSARMGRLLVSIDARTVSSIAQNRRKSQYKRLLFPTPLAVMEHRLAAAHIQDRPHQRWAECPQEHSGGRNDGEAGKRMDPLSRPGIGI